MSATERKPELVREGRRLELAYMIAEARRDLDAIRAETASLRRRIHRHLHGPRSLVAARVLAGVLAFPVVVLLGVSLAVPICHLLW